MKGWMLMAKDGSNRGGARTGAGRKKKALADKVAEGKADNLLVLPTTNFSGVEMPPPKEYLKAPQKNGQENCAAEISKRHGIGSTKRDAPIWSVRNSSSITP